MVASLQLQARVEQYMKQLAEVPVQLAIQAHKEMQIRVVLEAAKDILRLPRLDCLAQAVQAYLDKAIQVGEITPSFQAKLAVEAVAPVKQAVLDRQQAIHKPTPAFGVDMADRGYNIVSVEHQLTTQVAVAGMLVVIPLPLFLQAPLV